MELNQDYDNVTSIKKLYWITHGCMNGVHLVYAFPMKIL